jgi:hypothetical protein
VSSSNDVPGDRLRARRSRHRPDLHAQDRLDHPPGAVGRRAVGRQVRQRHAPAQPRRRAGRAEREQQIGSRRWPTRRTRCAASASARWRAT